MGDRADESVPGKWVLELKGHGFGVFSAQTEKAAWRRGRQIVLDKFLSEVRPATKADLETLHAMGGSEM